MYFHSLFKVIICYFDANNQEWLRIAKHKKHLFSTDIGKPFANKDKLNDVKSLKKFINSVFCFMFILVGVFNCPITKLTLEIVIFLFIFCCMYICINVVCSMCVCSMYMYVYIMCIYMYVCV